MDKHWFESVHYLDDGIIFLIVGSRYMLGLGPGESLSFVSYFKNQPNIKGLHYQIAKVWGVIKLESTAGSMY